MPDVTAMRYEERDHGDGVTVVEVDALVAVEVSDLEAPRGIDLHLSPRTDDVVTVSLSASEAWALARELARAATDRERDRLG